MAKTPEARVKDKIKKIIKGAGGYYAMPVMQGMAYNGTPDFLCCVGGWFVAIEAKAGKNKPTELQEVRMKEIRAAGGIAIVVNDKNLDKLKSLVTALANKPRTQ